MSLPDQSALQWISSALFFFINLVLINYSALVVYDMTGHKPDVLNYHCVVTENFHTPPTEDFLFKTSHLQKILGYLHTFLSNCGF